MKISKSLLIITTLLCFLPCVLGLIMWSELPAELPAHWGLNGDVDNYMSKAVVIFVFPAVLAAIHVICHLVSGYEKRSRNYSKVLFSFICWFIPALSNIMMTIILLAATGKKVNVLRVELVAFGLMFIFIGNYLPKCKQNSTMGIRIPWTLKSEENWNKTHHLAGWLWMISGLVVVIAGFVNLPVIAIVVFTLMITVPVIYSWRLSVRG